MVLAVLLPLPLAHWEALAALLAVALALVLALAHTVGGALAEAVGALLPLGVALPEMDTLTLAVPLRQGGSTAPPTGLRFCCAVRQAKGTPPAPNPTPLPLHVCTGSPTGVMAAGQLSSSACPASIAGEAAAPKAVGETASPPGTAVQPRDTPRAPNCARAPVPYSSSPTPLLPTSSSAGSEAVRRARGVDRLALGAAGFAAPMVSSALSVPAAAAAAAAPASATAPRVALKERPEMLRVRV